jgi:hypothetical protein
MLKVLIAAAALSGAPLAAFAACTAHERPTAASCAEGSVYDAEKGKCVVQITG